MRAGRMREEMREAGRIDGDSDVLGKMQKYVKGSAIALSDVAEIANEIAYVYRNIQGETM